MCSVNSLRTPTVCFMFLGLLFVISQTDGAMFFTKTPPSTVYVAKGSAAVLKWEYYVDRNPAELAFITWKVFVKAQRSYKAMIVEYNSRVIVHPSLPVAYVHRVEKKEQATLIVKNVTFEDSTRFQCVLTSYSGVTKKDTVQLIITGPASCEPQIQLVEVGDSATIICNATGVPSKNKICTGPGLPEKKVVNCSQFTIKDISLSDAGYYSCDATVNINEANVAVCFVQVVFPPKQDDTSCTLTSYSVAVGEQLSICCPVSGYPPPLVTWEKNGTRPLKGENTVLIITSVKDEDFGKYTCTATHGIASIGPFVISVMKKSIIKKP